MKLLLSIIITRKKSFSSTYVESYCRREETVSSRCLSPNSRPTAKRTSPVACGRCRWVWCRLAATRWRRWCWPPPPWRWSCPGSSPASGSSWTLTLSASTAWLTDRRIWSSSARRSSPCRFQTWTGRSQIFFLDLKTIRLHYLWHSFSLSVVYSS